MITLWSLYNSVDKIQIDDLKTEQVRIVLLSIPTVRMKDWMICKKGDVHWQSLLQVPEFFEDVRDLKGDTQGIELEASPAKKAPAPPSRRPLFEDINLDSEDTLSLMDETQSFAEVKERRTARRYVKTLELVIKTSGINFQTETVDVSMSGLSVKDTLPENLKKQFPATLSYKGYHLKVVLERVEDDPTGSKLKIHDVDQWDTLRSWVVGW